MNRIQPVTVETPLEDKDRQKIDLNCKSSQLARLAKHLDYCGQKNKTVTYLEVADALNIQAPHRIHRVTEILEILMEYDQKNHQPLRAALVVSRARNGLPADGFFLKAQALGLMQGLAEEEFHQRCLHRVFNNSSITNSPPNLS